MMTIMSPTPSRKEISHDRIVEAASRAIRRAGYQGVGVADIMKEAGLTHGGFYAHFESRDALLVEAVQRAGRDSAAALSERVAQRRAQGETPLAAALNMAITHPARLMQLDALSGLVGRQGADVLLIAPDLSGAEFVL